MNYLDHNLNFLGLERPNSFEYEDSRICIQSFPYEYTSSYHKGSKKGPEAILKASHFVEFYDEEIDREICFEKGITTVPITQFKKLVNEDALNLIEQETLKHLKNNKFIVSLGAEHTVSYGIVKAFIKQYPNLSILQIDAHSDLRPEYEGNKWSHASVMSRCLELGISKLTQIGIRAQSKEESQIIKDNSDIETIYAHEINKSSNWLNKVINSLGEDVYITIDADGFDPSIMPAVGTAEPNGLLWNQAMELFKAVFESKNVVGIDVVECAPRQNETLTEYNLAKLIYKLIGLKFK